MRAIGLLLLASAIPSMGMAKDKPPKADNVEVDCIGGARWGATLAEGHNAESVPVPPSYRAIFESTAPCAFWGLDKEALVDFQIAFGTVQSATIALAYLEQGYLKELVPPADYPAAVRAAYRAALPDLKRAATVKQPPGATYSALHKFLEGRPHYQRFDRLTRGRDEYVFIATQYLRAAEEFDDPALLDKAEAWFRAAADTSAFLAPIEEQPPVKSVMYFNLHPYATDDLAARIAIRRAIITRNPGDIDRAGVVLAAQDKPIYRRLIEDAFSGGSDLCDISDGVNGGEELATACREDDDEIDMRVFDIALNRAMLDTIADPAGDDASKSIARAERLLRLEQAPDFQKRCCRRYADDDLIRLWRTRAAGLARSLGTPVDDSETDTRWRQALDTLQFAIDLAPPAKTPARFARLARAWLALWDRRDALFAKEEEPRRRPDSVPSLHRQAAYLRVTLAALDTIRTGGQP